MVRTVVIADKNTLVVVLPEDYVGKQVEVIVFSVDEGTPQVKNERKKVSFNATELDTTGYKFNREEANER